jgi:hypothetical protein
VAGVNKILSNVKFVLKEWWLYKMELLVALVLMILKTALTLNVLPVYLTSLTLKTVNAAVLVRKLKSYVMFAQKVWWFNMMVLIVDYVLMILMIAQTKFVKIVMLIWPMLITENAVVNVLLFNNAKYVQKVWWLSKMVQNAVNV